MNTKFYEKIASMKNSYIVNVVYNLDDVITYQFENKKAMIDFNNYLNNNFTDTDIKAVISEIYISDIDNIKHLPELSKFADIPKEYKNNRYSKLDTVGLLINSVWM